MLRVALAQIEVIPGRPDLNCHTMLDKIEEARQLRADIVVFPELCISGYLLGDTWEQSAFLRDCEHYGQQIINASRDICTIFGNIAVDWTKKNDDGRVRKYNALFVAYQGQLHGQDNFPYPFRIKTLQPNYREFDDSRHFYSLRKLATEQNISVNNLLKPVQLKLNDRIIKLGCLLCEDGWSDDYAVHPIDIIQQNGPVDAFINISSSPYTLGKNNKRNRVFSKQARDNATPLIYVNNIGIQNNGKTVYTFDGYSTVYNSSGEIIAHCPPFEQCLKVIDITTGEQETCYKSLVGLTHDDTIKEIYQSLYFGIDRFLKSIGMSKIVIGISGGIDSAVNAALYSKVIGPENVLLVNMPSKYNSQTTKDLAAQLACNLGCLYTVVPIQDAVDLTINQLNTAKITNLSNQQQTNLTISPLTAENIQARDRSARVLAGLAAAWGGGFTCNANKTELSVGYSTLYGDQSGVLAATADLWKYQIYQLAYYLNSEVYGREIIPQATIDIVPSAELSPEQCVDEGKGDPIIYPYHDYLFRAFVEHWNRATPEDILEWYSHGMLEEKLGCQKGITGRIFVTTEDFINDLEKWWKLYTGMAVAKRIQAPPVLAVSRRAFGFDHRESQNGPYFTKRYLDLKKHLLR